MITWAIVIVIVVLLLFVFILLTMGESVVKISAGKAGNDTEDYSVLPTSVDEVLGKSKGKATYIPAKDSVTNLKRGFDISLVGKAQVGDGIERVRVANYAIKPKDFLGMAPIPKILVEEGGRVKAGDALFFDKNAPEVIYAAPISGTVTSIVRAEKRSIAAVVIAADQGEVEYRSYQVPDLASVSREQLVEFLLESGAWPFIRQRPYDRVANHKATPKGIFISTFDTAPLAPDLNLAVEGKEAAFQKGLDVLALLGKVHLGLDGRGKCAPSKAFAQAQNVEKHWFNGKHPVGNVGVQIHHTDPINSGDAVWYLDVQGVLVLGMLFLEGKFDTERLVAVCGAEVSNAHYVRIHQGAQVEGLLVTMPADMVPTEDYVWEEFETDKVGKDGKKIKDKNKVLKTVNRRAIRIVSGDPLTGKQIERQGFLGFFDDQLTTIKEGDYYEILGWLIPQTGHPSLSRTFPGGFAEDAQYVADTNTNGEKRAFVMTGEYESVLPMDIYPQHLFRAILANDIEKMEGLGILELSEEDVALCEYVCTSKQPLQKMLRQGLETLLQQG